MKKFIFRLLITLLCLLLSFTLFAQTPNKSLNLKLTYLKYKAEKVEIDFKNQIDLKLSGIKKYKYNIYSVNGNITIPRFYINDERSFYFFRTFF